jgi:hypothetical protein
MLDAAAVGRELERLGLDPKGVDLAWIARVKADAEERIAEFRDDPQFVAAVSPLAIVPPAD